MLHGLKGKAEIFFFNMVIKALERRENKVVVVSFINFFQSQILFSEAALERCSQEKGALKICSKFTGEHPCPSVVAITAFSR